MHTVILINDAITQAKTSVIEQIAAIAIYSFALANSPFIIKLKIQAINTGNKRTYKNIALAMLKHITEQLCSGETFSSPFHMVSSAAGKANSAGDAKPWLIALDTEYLDYENEVKELIAQCEPFDKEKVKVTIPSKSGKHIITYPFNIQKFSQLWCLKHPDMKMPDYHKDNPVIIFCPYDNVLHCICEYIVIYTFINYHIFNF